MVVDYYHIELVCVWGLNETKKKKFFFFFFFFDFFFFFFGKKSPESAPKFSGRSGNRKHNYFFFLALG